MKLGPLVIGTALGGLLATAAPGSAADGTITYYEDVAPIMLAHCATCHKPAARNIGSLVAPMSLLTYEETRPWARSIARKVRTKEMPPWFAEYPKGVFSNERGLTDQQIDTILAWVDADAPAGDKAKAPAPPVSIEAASGGYSLGKPDLIVKMKPYVVADEAEDVQAIFSTTITEQMLPNDVTIQGWEFRTGTYIAGADTVHHMCGDMQLPGSSVAAAADESAGASLGCVAGGAEPHMLPEGFGMAMKKGSTVSFNMHYYKQPGPGTAFTNQPEVGFYFARGPIKYKVHSSTTGSPTGFEIPPRKADHKIGSAHTLEKDTMLLAFWPHAHLRAKAVRYTATYPDGRKEILLDVPRYDQTWQVTYKLKNPKLLPAGTRIDFEGIFDNSPDRAARQRFNADKAVVQGPRTQDEMLIGFFSYAELEPGQQVPAIVDHR